MPTLHAGDPAPDVSFTGANRTEYKLAEFRGNRNVVVAFYPRAFTGGCEREMRHFQTILDEFQSQDTIVLGSSTDPAPAQNAFAEHCGLQFPLVSDFPAYSAAKAFGVFNDERVANARVTFIIDKEGIIRHVIEDSQDMQHHGNEALEVVKKL